MAKSRMDTVLDFDSDDDDDKLSGDGHEFVVSVCLTTATTKSRGMHDNDERGRQQGPGVYPTELVSEYKK